LRSYDATHPHTAHQPSLATVYYRYHPFVGEEVEILRRSRRSPAESVLVRLCRDGAQVVVPCWMLDAGFCAGLVDEDQPRLNVAALTELRRLLDSQPLLASIRQQEHEKGRIPKKRR
jgi:hypothetical protein